MANITDYNAIFESKNKQVFVVSGACHNIFVA